MQFLAPTKPVKRSIESEAMEKRKEKRKKIGEEKKEKKERERKREGGKEKERREENGPMLLSPWNHHGKGRINLASRRANGPFAPRFRCN